MCLAAIGSWLTTYGSTAAAVAGAASSIYTATQAGKGGADPAAAQAAADATAAKNANGRLALRRKALQGQSLVTGGGDVMSSGILGGGKPTLGG